MIAKVRKLLKGFPGGPFYGVFQILTTPGLGGDIIPVASRRSTMGQYSVKAAGVAIRDKFCYNFTRPNEPFARVIPLFWF